MNLMQNNKFFKIFIFVSLFCLIAVLFLLYSTVFKSDKIAYVDSAVIINEYKGAMSARKGYETKAKVWQANIDTLSQGVQNAIKKHEKDFANMSAKEQQLSKELIGNKQKQL